MGGDTEFEERHHEQPAEPNREADGDDHGADHHRFADLDVLALRGDGRRAHEHPRAEDEGLDGLSPGDKLWLGWSPTATLLLGPVDGSEPATSSEPLEVQA